MFNRNAAVKTVKVKRFVFGSVKFVTSAPTAEIRVLHIVETVWNQAQPRRSVALHTVSHVGINLAHRSVVLLNIFRKPLIRNVLRLGCGVVVHNAAPSGVAVAARTHDVKKFGEIFANPNARIVLVGNCIDAEF